MKRKLLGNENEAVLNFELINLPFEILLLIFSQLNLFDLLKVSRSCRLFNKLKKQRFSDLIEEIEPSVKNILLNLYCKENPNADLSDQTVISEMPYTEFLSSMNAELEYEGVDKEFDKEKLDKKKLAMAILFQDCDFLMQYPLSENLNQIDNHVRFKLTNDDFFRVSLFGSLINIPHPKLLSYLFQCARNFFKGKKSTSASGFVYWLAMAGELDEFKKEVAEVEFEINKGKLFYWAILGNRLDVVQYLIESVGAPFSEVAWIHKTFYEFRIYEFFYLNRVLPLLTYLVEKKLYPNEDFGWLFSSALSKNQFLIAEFLMNQNLITLEQLSKEGFLTQSQKGFFEREDWFNEKEINLGSDYYRSQLMECLEKFNSEKRMRIIEFIFSEKAISPNFVIENSDWSSAAGIPLFRAIQNNLYFAVQCLLDHGAMITEPIFQTGGGRITIHPLWSAIENQNEKVVRLLHERQASFNFYGWTPIFVAAVKGCDTIVNFYREKGVVKIERLDMGRLVKYISVKAEICDFNEVAQGSFFALDFKKMHDELDIDNVGNDGKGIFDLIEAVKDISDVIFFVNPKKDFSNVVKNCNLLVWLELQAYIFKLKNFDLRRDITEKLILQIHTNLDQSPKKHLAQVLLPHPASTFSFFGNAQEKADDFAWLHKLINHLENHKEPQIEEVSELGFQLNCQ